MITHMVLVADAAFYLEIDYLYTNHDTRSDAWVREGRAPVSKRACRTSSKLLTTTSARKNWQSAR